MGPGIWWAINGHSNCLSWPGAAPHLGGDTWESPRTRSQATCPSARQGGLLATPPRLCPAPSSPHPRRATAAEPPCPRTEVAAACALPSGGRLVPAPRGVTAPCLQYAIPVLSPAWGCWLRGGQGGDGVMPGSVSGWVQAAPQPGTGCLWEQSWIPQSWVSPRKSPQAKPRELRQCPPHATRDRGPPHASLSPPMPPPWAGGRPRRAVPEGELVATPAGLAWYNEPLLGARGGRGGEGRGSSCSAARTAEETGETHAQALPLSPRHPPRPAPPPTLTPRPPAPGGLGGLRWHPSLRSLREPGAAWEWGSMRAGAGELTVGGMHEGGGRGVQGWGGLCPP